MSEPDIKSVAFKMETEIIDAASEVLKKNGYSLRKALMLFLKNIALTETVDLPDEDELENALLFM